MDNEVKSEAVGVDVSQQEQEQPSNGETTKPVSNSPATATESKKEGRSNNGKDGSGRDSGRSSRRDRDRSSRNRRRSRSPVRGREDRTNKCHRTCFVANFPYQTQWTELKDLFRDKVGNVRFCQLFENEEGKPRGCGLVEFDDSASAKKAIETLNRYEFRGRELVVKEDLDIERDRFGKLILPSSRREGRDRDPGHHRGFDDRSFRNGSDSVSSSASSSYNTYGLSPQFLSSLGVKGPLNNRVFVANIDWSCDERSITDVFRLAGKVTKVKLYYDRDGKSKGFGVVEFEHPVEAVQAISMFNNQRLHSRILSVRLDRFDEENPNGDGDFAPSKLPSGLEGIGKGLGLGGQPLNISQSMFNNPPGHLGAFAGDAAQAPVAPAPLSTVVPQAASAAITALTNLAGNLQNLPNLAQSLAQLSSSTVPGRLPLGTSSITPSGYPPSGSEFRQAPAPIYGGYQAVPQPGSGAPQQPPPPYVSSQMGSGTYGQPPTNATPAASYSSPASAAPLNSYSTYEQRDYRDDKYRSSSSADTVYIRNLPLTSEITRHWQNIQHRLQEIGQIRFAEMKGHGTALVRFVNSQDAQRACTLLNGIRIDNRPIDVDLYY